MATVINAYDAGDLVKLTVAFTVNNVATDPTSVACSVRDPLGVESTPSVAHDATGAYSALLDLTGAYPGIWSYRWTGTGACQAAEEQTFYVRESAFA